MIIVGKNACRETLKAKKIKVDTIIIDSTQKDNLYPQIASMVEKSTVVKFVPKSAFAKYTTSAHHQGIILITQEFQYCDLQDLIEKTKSKKCTFIICDGILDPHNFGSIIRTAECSGADGIIIGKNRNIGVNDTVIKVSSGAVNFMPVARVTNINDAIRTLKDNFVTVCALDMDGKNIYDYDLNQNIALVIGGEGSGVSVLTRKLCDDILSFPLLGKINSLNASICTSLALYETVRQKMKG